jgi:hypothetical protein
MIVQISKLIDLYTNKIIEKTRELVKLRVSFQMMEFCLLVKGLRKA